MKLKNKLIFEPKKIFLRNFSNASIDSSLPSNRLNDNHSNYYPYSHSNYNLNDNHSYNNSNNNYSNYHSNNHSDYDLYILLYKFQINYTKILIKLIFYF